MPRLKVLVSDNQSDLSICQENIQEIVGVVLEQENRDTDEVCVHFVATKEICQLHQQYFNDPSTTDCISFPIDGPEETEYNVLGEVFVCPETAINYVKENGGDKYQECTLYLVHGLLHLLGYDDISEEDEGIMRSREKLHMDRLLKQNLILKPHTKEACPCHQA